MSPCSRCGRPRENRHRYCRECQSAYMRAWRAAGRERRTEEHRRRANARRRACSAVASGLIRREPCVVCGSTDDIEMHHSDYDRPLDVEWRYRVHHLEIPRDRILT